MAPWIAIARMNWPIRSGSQRDSTVDIRLALDVVTYATPAVSRRPANIQPNAPISSCWTSAGAGRTPSWLGDRELGAYWLLMVCS